MTAYHFALTTIDTGGVLGHALLCPEARYASTRWREADRLCRGFALATTWPSVIEDLRIGWAKGLVAPSCAAARLLVPEDVIARVTIQLMTQPQVSTAEPDQAPRLLDTYLWAQAFE